MRRQTAANSAGQTSLPAAAPQLACSAPQSAAAGAASAPGSRPATVSLQHPAVASGSQRSSAHLQRWQRSAPGMCAMSSMLRRNGQEGGWAHVYMLTLLPSYAAAAQRSHGASVAWRDPAQCGVDQSTLRIASLRSITDWRAAAPDTMAQ